MSARMDRLLGPKRCLAWELERALLNTDGWGFWPTEKAMVIISNLDQLHAQIVDEAATLAWALDLGAVAHPGELL